MVKGEIWMHLDLCSSAKALEEVLDPRPEYYKKEDVTG